MLNIDKRFQQFLWGLLIMILHSHVSTKIIKERFLYISSPSIGIPMMSLEKKGLICDSRR